MILVDTSVWIDHLNSGDSALQELLEVSQVMCHPLVIGELAMGNLRHRDVILNELHHLPGVIVAEEFEVLRFVSERGLFGLGIGYIDAHLLASARLTPDTRIWTRDKRMREIAVGLSLAFEPIM